MKTTIILFAIGAVTVFIGAYMKLNFIEYSRLILLLGLIIEGIALIHYVSNSRKTKKNLVED